MLLSKGSPGTIFATKIVVRYLPIATFNYLNEIVGVNLPANGGIQIDKKLALGCEFSCRFQNQTSRLQGQKL